MTGEKKFLADGMLGKCAKWLRFLGCDVEYFSSGDKFFLAFQAVKENRLVLTRDRKFCEIHPGISLFIRSEKFLEQILEIKEKGYLKIDPERFFTRCSQCNAVLLHRKPEDAKEKVPPYVYMTQKRFFQCPVCGKFFWRGTHWNRITRIIENL